MGWSRTEIDGKTCDLFEPQQPHDPARVLLHLHGASLKTLAESGEYTNLLERHGMVCVCPHGQRSWWLDRVWPGFDSEISPIAFLRERVVPWIEDRWQVQPPRIALSGISMGGQGALQIAYRWPREFPLVAAISPAVDFHQWHGQDAAINELFATPEAARQETALLRLNPVNWPKHQLIVSDPADAEWFESADRLCMKLRSIGIPHDKDLETSQGGHGWDYFDAMAGFVLDWIAARIDLVAGNVELRITTRTSNQ